MPRLSDAPLLLIALVLALAAGCKKHEPPPEGDIVETLRAKTMTGADFDPHTLRGKPSIVLFVSPTCPHCVEELPAAQAAAKAHDANVVAVFIAGKAENAKGVLEHTKFEGVALIDDGSLRRRYGVRAVPYTLVLGADGHAREQFRGGQGESTLSDAIADAR
ncbi:MAG: TlpA family protein disulfide reductase [Myxococcales bacterium]|nr:TlpA family protein disulfide reductase [Myxococcales bacterium]